MSSLGDYFEYCQNKAVSTSHLALLKEVVSVQGIKLLQLSSEVPVKMLLSEHKSRCALPPLDSLEP